MKKLWVLASCLLLWPTLALAQPPFVSTIAPPVFIVPASAVNGAGVVNRPGLGATTTAGITLLNGTAAAAGAQQYSPGLSLIGQGWSTDAGGASMPVETRWELRPVQGAAAPSMLNVLSYRINGGAWSDVVSLDSSQLKIGSVWTWNNGSMISPATAIWYWLGRTVVASSADGSIQFTPNAQTTGVRLQFAALPTIASGFCVAGGTNVVATGSTDTAGRVTMGTCAAETTGTITFATAWSATGPITCLAQNESTPASLVKAAPNALTGAVSLALTQSVPFVTGDIVKWICLGPK